MERSLEVFDGSYLEKYQSERHLCKHERDTLQEILLAVSSGDKKSLAWFAGFGKSLHHILLNVHAYRKGLEFGFTGIDFDLYGWLVKPVFLEVEETEFGRTDKAAGAILVPLR